VEVKVGTADQPETGDQSRRFELNQVSDDRTVLVQALIHQAPEQALAASSKACH
jgi:hypothetical protein